MAPQSVIDLYRKEIYRIGWKIQYQAKVTYRREVPIVSDFFYGHDDSTRSESHFLARQLIESLPSETERTVVHELYLKDKTEAQVARQLNISQQAVSKWKKKALRTLCQKTNL